MPSSFTRNLGIEKPADGEQDGVWGDIVNDNMDIIDSAINGGITLSLSGTSSTLTTSDGSVSDGQNKFLILGGSPSGTHTITISPSDAEKIYFVYNNSGQSVIFTQGSGGNITVANNTTAFIYADGGGATAAVTSITDRLSMGNATIGATTLTVAGASTLTGDVTFGGSLREDIHSLSGTSPALDPSNGTIQTWTLSGNSSPTDSLQSGESLTLMIDDGAAYSITWPTMTWKTGGGSAPTLLTSGFTVIVLWKVSTTLYGARVGDA